MKYKRFICKGCFGNFPRSTNKQICCLDKCLNKKFHPCTKCDTNNSIFVLIGLVNGSKELRAYCKDCRKHETLPLAFVEAPFVKEIIDVSENIYNIDETKKPVSYIKIENNFNKFWSDLVRSGIAFKKEEHQ